MRDTTTLAGRPPSASHLTLSQIMDQHHTNLMGTVHGGRILNLIDSVAGVVAARHRHSPAPVAPGDIGAQGLTDEAWTLACQIQRPSPALFRRPVPKASPVATTPVVREPDRMLARLPVDGFWGGAEGHGCG
ncbi:hotdog domain-containing protein [Micromonospora sp. CB01531]|uniref:hotdog domain-containing protein n=1 Tax=Micromonospora sp. CB01531 TaxID=1718947 RepID=UPI000ACE666F|nr:hotdog domain-containing protein [Micromonospora sp. CB01531]